MSNESTNQPHGHKHEAIPSRFRGVKKSFVNRLASSSRTMGVGSFGAFPKDVSFSGIESDEDVIIVVRRSPAAFIWQFFLIVALLLSPIGLFMTLSVLNLEASSSVALGVAGSLVLFLIAITVAFDTFLKWYFSVNIITDQRIVDVDFVNVLYHRFSETQLERVEDVSHEVAGLLGSIFDFGTVYLQTAATIPEFEFVNIPQPRDVQDTILDLLELKQKGEI